MRFRDRVDAGRRLAAAVGHLRRERPVVLGLPRGGVPVAAEVARALGAPLDVILVRKLGAPGDPELAMGAIGEGGVRVLDRAVVHHVGVDDAQLERVVLRERTELASRAARFRGDAPAVPLVGRTALIVDDGIATGSTARAACEVARAHGAARVVVAVPVAPPDWCDAFVGFADELIAVETPAGFRAVGQWYDHFEETTDAEVVRCLRRAAPGHGAVDDDVVVAADGVLLDGHLTVPRDARGLVVFAHGNGSGHTSPRIRFVARALVDAGIGTLLFDLLTPIEADDAANVFDVRLLGRRVADAVAWLRRQPVASTLPVGLFGASTGAGAALWMAADPTAGVAAVVSQSGRPDLAGGRLGAVRAPTLLVVGERDEVVLDVNRRALRRLDHCAAELVVVPGAGHLFDEPGALATVADAAQRWFVTHLAPQEPSP